jgi:hypothetical protein
MCLWAMAMAMLRPQPAAWRLMETARACARLARATGRALGHPGLDPGCLQYMEMGRNTPSSKKKAARSDTDGHSSDRHSFIFLPFSHCSPVTATPSFYPFPIALELIQVSSANPLFSRVFPVRRYKRWSFPSCH